MTDTNWTQPAEEFFVTRERHWPVSAFESGDPISTRDNVLMLLRQS